MAKCIAENCHCHCQPQEKIFCVYNDEAAGLQKKVEELEVENQCFKNLVHIDELIDLLTMLRGKIGGDLWTLFDEDRQEAIRVNNQIDALETLLQQTNNKT